VRTIAVVIAAILAGPLALATAQEGPKFTINPTMARGPATAPVTIVEFSDYQ
jgi:hypothetical protein